MSVITPLCAVALVMAAVFWSAQAAPDTCPQRSLEAQLAYRLTKGGCYARPADKFVRPVRNNSETLMVNLRLSIIHINSFDPRTGIISMTTWMTYDWQNNLMKWNPKHYSGINTIRLPVSAMWRPDITVYNRIGAKLIEEENFLAVVYNSGKILHIPSVDISTKCKRDQQAEDDLVYTCTVKLGSWTYDGYHLDLAFFDGKEDLNMDDYQTDPDYKILAHSAVKEVKQYPCCVEPYPSITYTLKFKYTGMSGGGQYAAQTGGGAHTQVARLALVLSLLWVMCMG